MDHSKNAQHIFNVHASGYQEKYMDVYRYHDGFDAFIKEIPKENADILDIACGPGNVTKYILQQRPLYTVLGIDLAENMVAFAKANNPKASFKIMDARKINLLSNHYHGILCGFGLPYLSKEEVGVLIQDSFKLLHTNGCLYLSTMEDDYSVSGFVGPEDSERLYTYYHQGEYLEKMLLDTGFKIISVNRQPFKHDNGTEYTDIILIAKKH